MRSLAALLLVSVLQLVAEADGQPAAIIPAVVSAKPDGVASCIKLADCNTNQFCRMYDFHRYPAMWPPCRHTGYCFCEEGFAQASNGTCVPYVLRKLNDRCSNSPWERVRSPEERCDGHRVVCNTPDFVMRDGYCQPVPLPTFSPDFLTTRPAVALCPAVAWLEQCDDSKMCCDASRGLTCQTRDPRSGSRQCLCSEKLHAYDTQRGYCRPRVYGDLCTHDSDCKTGLIANAGVECRLGRCRCSVGFEPYDNLYWNETSLSTYKRRICVSLAAVSWAPTGSECTLNPESHADSNATRVCHSRAFCHRCYHERQSGADTGVCRELTCSDDVECGFQGVCSRWRLFVDPPCQQASCDCNWATGFWKDRFSRCSPMRQLWLGDRCLTSANGLHPWYPNNENWDNDKECVADAHRLGGYAGYAWGTVKCKLPLVEDDDGNCVRNDDRRGILETIVDYKQACDDDDRRLPRRVCDPGRGLVCRNRVCQCAASTVCATSYVACAGTAQSAAPFWDGSSCRVRTFGEPCASPADCCGGTCTSGACACPRDTKPVSITTTTISNGGERAGDPALKRQIYCLRNASVAGKGGVCHADPVAWNCAESWSYGVARSKLSPLVCSPGLTCLRCPADFYPSDEMLGVCRAVKPLRIPTGTCGRGALSASTRGYYRNAGTRATAWAPLCLLEAASLVLLAFVH